MQHPRAEMQNPRAELGNPSQEMPSAAWKSASANRKTPLETRGQATWQEYPFPYEARTLGSV